MFLSSLLPPYSPAVWKALIGCGLGILLLGAVLLTFQFCGNFWTGRDIKKARANVNAALVEVNNAKGTVANDKVDEAVAVDHLKQAANDVIAASTASDEAKAAANQAVANFVAAKAANRPTGTTEADLDAKLRALGE